MNPINCFKAYDIRGRVPEELNPSIAARIGLAFGSYLRDAGATLTDDLKFDDISKIKCVIGHDPRLSSPTIAQALCAGLQKTGVEIIWIGLCGSEEIYYATQHLNAAGAMVTASHNPSNYNGLKLLRQQAIPIDQATGLEPIRQLAEQSDEININEKLYPQDDLQDHGAQLRQTYTNALLQEIDLATLKPLKIVSNAGNGSAGALIDELAPKLPFELVRINHQPDGSFPHGVPNPLIKENRHMTSDAVKLHQADLGIAWDTDCDRCFFFDAKGNYINGVYICSVLAQHLLQKSGGGTIIHDPRLIWCMQDAIASAGGKAVCSNAGHSVMKRAMREHNAIYGGEVSGHHFFHNFGYCDSGMLPWLLIGELMCQKNCSLNELTEPFMNRFPASEEHNLDISGNPKNILDALAKKYSGDMRREERQDGLSMAFETWRCNIRPSNTEPRLRINVEARGDKALLERKTKGLLQEIEKIKDAL